MRIKLTFKKPKWGTTGFCREYEMQISIYDNRGDCIAREYRDINFSDIEDGEHFSFPELKLVGIDEPCTHAVLAPTQSKGVS